MVICQARGWPWGRGWWTAGVEPNVTWSSAVLLVSSSCVGKTRWRMAVQFSFCFTGPWVSAVSVMANSSCGKHLHVWNSQAYPVGRIPRTISGTVRAAQDLFTYYCILAGTAESPCPWREWPAVINGRARRAVTDTSPTLDRSTLVPPLVQSVFRLPALKYLHNYNLASSVSLSISASKQ